MQVPSALLSPSQKKIKNLPRKKSLLFLEIKLFALILKNILIFSKKKAFLIFLEIEPWTSWPKIKKFKNPPREND